MMRAVLLVWLAVLLAACGGSDGVGSGGTGAPVVHSGTVTGFGSVIVDDTAYDDRNATVERETAEGGSETATLRLGHRVEVELGDAEDVARAFRVRPESVGVVTAVGATSLQVLGQEVRINTDARAGPRTQFGGGLTSLADVRTGQRVEVHGVRRRIDGASVVQATRIERVAALSELVVAGVVEDFDAAARSFRIGALRVDASDARFAPPASGLADGRQVVVWAAAGGLGGSDAAPVLKAERVRIAERRNGRFEAVLAGVLEPVDGTAARFTLGGVTVDVSEARVVPPQAELGAGRYARVTGRWADDGSFVASRVQLRGAGGGNAAKLTGPVADWNAAAQTFTVRGVPVDASGATLQSCPGGGLADGLRVRVDGDLNATGVVATTVRCIGN